MRMKVEVLRIWPGESEEPAQGEFQAIHRNDRAQDNESCNCNTGSQQLQHPSTVHGEVQIHVLPLRLVRITLALSGAPPGATLALLSKRRDRRVRPLQRVVRRRVPTLSW